MGEDEAGEDDRQELADGHDERKVQRAVLLDGVEDEELHRGGGRVRRGAVGGPGEVRRR